MGEHRWLVSQLPATWACKAKEARFSCIHSALPQPFLNSQEQWITTKIAIAGTTHVGLHCGSSKAYGWHHEQSVVCICRNPAVYLDFLILSFAAFGKFLGEPVLKKDSVCWVSFLGHQILRVGGLPSHQITPVFRGKIKLFLEACRMFRVVDVQSFWLCRRGVHQIALECAELLVHRRYHPGVIAHRYCKMIWAVMQLLNARGIDTDMLPRLATDTVGVRLSLDSSFLQMLTCLDVRYKVINDLPEHVDYFHFTITTFLLCNKFYEGSFVCNTYRGCIFSLDLEALRISLICTQIVSVLFKTVVRML